MSTTVTEAADRTYGGFTSLELGFLIGGVGLGILIIIALINVCICCCGRDKKSKKYVKDEEKMVNMQTERTLNGQSAKQVIMKTKPNGNLDKYNQNNHPYQTMDPETNTVRYETAGNQSKTQDTPAVAPARAAAVTPAPVVIADPVPTPPPEPEPVVVDFHGSDGSSTKVITSQADADDDVDSGTGTSPTRAAAAVDVHEDQPPAEAAHENPAFDEDETPYASYAMPPPPPESMPPPLTPGTPVTDLDADETVIIPPPPPPQEDVYAQVNKNRGESTHEPESSTSISRNDSMMKSVWRPSSEIEIIEKAKF